jgi:HEAT repeat protein
VSIFSFFAKKGSNVERLIKALDNKDDRVRTKVRGEIVSLGEQAVEPLLKALSSSVWNIKSQAAIALGEIGDARAVDRLLQGLQEDIRIQSIKALGKIGDKRAEKPLFDALKDSNHSARAFAAEALGNMGHIEPLLNAVDDIHEFVKTTAIQALPAHKSDPRVVDALSRPLRNARDWATRWLAAEKLGELGDVRAERALTAALSDSNKMVREAAQESLTKIKAKQ